MFTGKEVLIVFYGIFWASIVSVIGRYRLFDTHLLFSKNMRRYILRRLAVGFVIMNMAPVFWFWMLYSCIVPEKLGVSSIASAAFASFSLFGFHRILHSFIATPKTYSYFYSKEELEEIIKQWGRGGPNTFVSHFWPGIGFLIGFLLIAFVIGKW